MDGEGPGATVSGTPSNTKAPGGTLAAPGQAGFPPRRVYSVFGVPPEVQAYAMAKYSRSSQGMLESIRELSQQKAEEFLNTFYFQYGHRSIADLAHLVFGVEQISILAAIALVDEQVWDGQERSTRYQPFRKTGWHTPAVIRGTRLERTYDDAAGALFSAYERLTEHLVEHLAAVVERPAELPEAAYRRTLRARAFDVSRALLPLATHTSVGQVVSARVLERQVSRLLSSVYPEVRAIGEELKQACQEPAESPLFERLSGPTGDDLELDRLIRPRAAPTLVKYARASPYVEETRRELGQAARAFLDSAGPADRTRAVDLVETGGAIVDEAVATLLFEHDRDGHSFRQAFECAAGLSEAQKQEVLGLSIRHRGRHDDLLRAHQAGYALIFDVLVDLGSFRDLHRHRRCVQVQQPLSWDHGFDRAEVVFRAGLGEAAAKGAMEEGLGDIYASALNDARAASVACAAVDPLVGDYLIPLAYRTRCLFKMDWSEAAYIVEARTTPAGHFSYRRIAWQMYEALHERYPLLASAIRASDPNEPFDLLQR